MGVFDDIKWNLEKKRKQKEIVAFHENQYKQLLNTLNSSTPMTMEEKVLEDGTIQTILRAEKDLIVKTQRFVEDNSKENYNADQREELGLTKEDVTYDAILLQGVQKGKPEYKYTSTRMRVYEGFNVHADPLRSENDKYSYDMASGDSKGKITTEKNMYTAINSFVNIEKLFKDKVLQIENILKQNTEMGK